MTAPLINIPNNECSRVPIKSALSVIYEINKIITDTFFYPTFIKKKKTGVCWGIPIFHIFAPKHRVWVIVRTASARRRGDSNVYPQSMFEQK